MANGRIRQQTAEVVFPAAGAAILIAWGVDEFSSHVISAEATGALTAVLAWVGAIINQRVTSSEEVDDGGDQERLF